MVIATPNMFLFLNEIGYIILGSCKLIYVKQMNRATACLGTTHNVYKELKRLPLVFIISRID